MRKFSISRIISIFLALSFTACFAQTADQIIEKVDSYRKVANSFSMKVKISDYKKNQLKDEAEFFGYFSGNQKSLVVCTKGKNRGMKVLMKGDNMWVSLPGSRRALRITPMQRLMGQASNGDVAKISFSQDYTGKVLDRKKNLIKILLKAKTKGATYQKVILYVNLKTYKPIKAEFFLLSGKHFKTAYYEDFIVVNGKRRLRKIKIQDMLRQDAYTIMEYANYKRRKVPKKYFNVMYLPRFEID